MKSILEFLGAVRQVLSSGWINIDTGKSPSGQLEERGQVEIGRKSQTTGDQHEAVREGFPRVHVHIVPTPYLHTPVRNSWLVAN